MLLILDKVPISHCASNSSDLVGPEEPSQVQSLSPHIADESERTDNNLAQRSASIAYDDVLLDGSVIRESVTSDDQDVLLELNTEEQEQFEVLDSADGEDEKSHDSLG